MEALLSPDPVLCTYKCFKSVGRHSSSEITKHPATGQKCRLRSDRSGWRHQHHLCKLGQHGKPEFVDTPPLKDVKLAGCDPCRRVLKIQIKFASCRKVLVWVLGGQKAIEIVIRCFNGLRFGLGCRHNLFRIRGLCPSKLRIQAVEIAFDFVEALCSFLLADFFNKHKFDNRQLASWVKDNVDFSKFLHLCPILVVFGLHGLD
ncbi:hypothetical protein Pst134EA_033025 [Puccinia striiformis f. sp. tritici]|uniref:hypothetical protein n=1 Tax=Puccinia striiformis f. sp. tritici TaxID=168172 RepID=UPI002007FBA6|nr:hypothetical protein Pst134EA_033025 [Puccinia striiformis f. sp. tritici]KAH9449418.1 hypothetical protein Pst134EB_033041 [Puccinia striiformis f. sp. tritici]KAH9459193.1 hypothetical protein Pst134EA_033025 [Puccinia striiformis f. sp. tritici]